MTAARDRVQAGMRHLQGENRRWPDHLVLIPEERWPPAALQAAGVAGVPPLEVWRSRAFLVLVYRERGHVRLSVLRTELALDGSWRDGITWDDLQRLKAECGRGHCWAVELFPPEDHVVNEANLRHVWILDAEPAYGWRKEQGDG